MISLLPVGSLVLIAAIFSSNLILSRPSTQSVSNPQVLGAKTQPSATKKVASKKKPPIESTNSSSLKLAVPSASLNLTAPSTSPNQTLSTPVPLPTNQSSPRVSPSLNPPTPNLPPNTQSILNIQSILDALNSYRAKNGVGNLSLDSKLADLANSRAATFVNLGQMDNHQGFNSLLNESGFVSLGFFSLGENSSEGFVGTATELIENFYGGHGPHNQNQLKADWSHVGIGVEGQFTDLVFGGNKQ